MEDSAPESSFLGEFLNPWYRSLASPEESQRAALGSLLLGYSKTEYGREHRAETIETISEFQHSFPVANYDTLSPYLELVRDGEYSALLPEPVMRWVMTRGTTGRPKLIPATETHVSLILSLGARGLLNFALRRDPMVLESKVLNLNFPSEVGTLHTERGEEPYGYSSGSYAKFHPSLGPTALVPKQEEIDALGGGISRSDWEKRYELVYQVSKDQAVGSVMGVTPVILGFARYLKNRHGVLPKEIWKMRGLFCTSVAKIQTRYAPMLRYQYGSSVPLVEMYTATEGAFAQQIDEHPYVCPNYDAFLFEVMTSRGQVKLLHELRPNEWGRIIISGPLFPRYDIGDMVESLGRNYFRVFGRSGLLTTLEHTLFEVLTGSFHY